MSRSVVVTLPITPRSTPKLGLLFTPLVMDLLKKQLGGYGILALNVNGVKINPSQVEDNVRGYLMACGEIGISPDQIWRDDSKENFYWVNHLFQQLMSREMIIRATRKVRRCSCRAVETLANAENFSEARKLYYFERGVVLCKLCQSIVGEAEDSVYLLRVPSLLTDFLTIPKFTGVEIGYMAKRFEGVELLISRTRHSAVGLPVDGHTIYLDPDFVWQLYLAILCKQGQTPSLLIGGQRNLLACYLSLLLARVLTGSKIDLVIPAYCQIKSDSDRVVLDGFRQWGRVLTRLFLVSHVAYHIKDTRFDTSLLCLVRALLPRLKGNAMPNHPVSLSESLARTSGGNLRQLLMQMHRSGSSVVDPLIPYLI